MSRILERQVRLLAERNDKVTSAVLAALNASSCWQGSAGGGLSSAHATRAAKRRPLGLAACLLSTPSHPCIPHLLVLGDRQALHTLSQRRQPRPSTQPVGGSAARRQGGEVDIVAKVAGLPAKAGPHLALVAHGPVEAHKRQAAASAPRSERRLSLGQGAEGQGAAAAGTSHASYGYI